MPAGSFDSAGYLLELYIPSLQLHIAIPRLLQSRYLLLTYLLLLPMQPLITLRRGRRADPKSAWALGYALTLEDIPRYGERYKCHFDCPNIDGPFFKVFDRWTDMALWMGRDLTKACGGKGVEVLGCLPRRPTRRQ